MHIYSFEVIKKLVRKYVNTYIKELEKNYYRIDIEEQKL